MLGLECPFAKLSWSRYGPTETAVWTTLYPVSQADAASASPEPILPIGRPFNERECYVVDRSLAALCPVGEVGELYVGGVGLAERYIADEHKTSAAFVAG